MPILSVFANPRRRKHRKNPAARRVATITNRVEEIRYKHREDGKWYKHKFDPGTSVELLADGSALLHRKDGKPSWMDDEALDSGRDDMHFFINHPTRGAKKAKSSRRRRRTTKARRPVSRHRPKKRSTDMARRKRSTRRRHVAHKRRHSVNARRRRRRPVAVTHYAANPRRRRRSVRRHLANPRRRHRRRYRHNPRLGFGSIVADLKNGAGVVAGQIVTRKIGGLAKQYVPGAATATGPMTLVSPLIGAVVTSIAARKFARGWAPFIAAGAFSEVINGAIALTPAASMLSAYPGAGVPTLKAWPGQPAALPPARAAGVRAWPARVGTVREVG